MKRTVVCLGLLAFAAGPSTLRSQGAPDPGYPLPDAWRHWRYSAPISVPEAGEPLLVRATVPYHVSRKAFSFWSDLRVIDDGGREIPFVLHAHLGQRNRVRREARLMDVTYQPGQDTRATVDLGPETAAHNGLEIETSEQEFFARVTIDVSPDGRAWRILQEAAPMYRFTSSGLEGNQTIRYTDNSSRYVRLRITGGEKRFPLSGVRAWHEVVEEAELLPLDVSLQPDVRAPAQETWWVAESLATGAPVSRIAFEIDQVAFHRPLRVRVTDDGQTWRTAGAGEIYRMKDEDRPGATRERLYVDFPEIRARALRVEMVNRDDPPLAGARPALLATPRRVVFQPAPGVRYRLLFGNPEATHPRYELTRVTSHRALESGPLGQVGAVAENTLYRDPAPWTERHPVVLWGALAVALLVLGALAVRALRTPGTFVPHTG